MSQMTDDMARRIIANWEATKNHYGITAWEECQLAYRWLHHGEAIRAAVAAERERDEARELSVQGSARLFAAMNFERDEWKRKAEEAARDSARLDWMIEHGTDEGGGSGFEFRVYIPHDSECLRDAIDAAIAAKGEA